MKLLREYIRTLISEGYEFRDLDSPLKYARAPNVIRIALCDTSETEPAGKRDSYFTPQQEWDYYGRSEGNRYIDTTIAHEYFHGVQLAYNAKMPPWTMEATCTWMESRVYDGGRTVFNIDPKYQEDLDQLIVPVELAMELGTKHKIFLLTPDKKSIRDDVSVIRIPPDEKTGKGLRWRIRDHQKNEENQFYS